MLKKVHLVLLTPFFAFLAFFFVACTPDNKSEINAGENVYPTSCRFENNDLVTLYSNDRNNQTNVPLIVEGQGITILPTINYNNQIIEYDVETGRITAIAPGQTSIVVSYQTSKDVYKQIFLNVVVKKSVFAQRVVLFQKYDFKLSQTVVGSQISAQEIITTSLGEYTGQLVYESLTPSIFSVDETGVVVPSSVGVGQIRVSAVSGYDATTDTYTYVSSTADVVVSEPIEWLSLDIVDSDYNTLTSISANSKIYNLYYGKKFGSNVENKYYFKLQCSEKIPAILGKDCDTSNLVVDGRSLHEASGGDPADEGRTYYIPFTVRDAGFEIVTYSCLDLGLNYAKNVYSNQVSFYSFAYMSELDVSCIAYAGEENIVENMYTVEPSSGTGEYTLYLLGGEEDDKLLGRTAGYTDYVNIKFSNINSYALNKLTIEHESGIVSNFNVLGHLYRVDAHFKGQTQVTFRADDESGWTKTLVFNVVYYQPLSYQFASFTGNKFSLVCDIDELNSQDLSLTSFAPAYAYINLTIQTTAISGTNPVVVDGNKVIANSAGQCYVVVTLNESARKTYLVTVYSKPDKIVFETPTSLSVECGSSYQMLFGVFDAQDNVVNGVGLTWICYDEDGNETHEFDDYIIVEFTQDGAYIQILQKGTYKLSIQTAVGERVYKDFTVVCV